MNTDIDATRRPINLRTYLTRPHAKLSLCCKKTKVVEKLEVDVEGAFRGLEGVHKSEVIRDHEKKKKAREFLAEDNDPPGYLLNVLEMSDRTIESLGQPIYIRHFFFLIFVTLISVFFSTLHR
eukprot:32630_1